MKAPIMFKQFGEAVTDLKVDNRKALCNNYTTLQRVEKDK